MQGLEYTEYAKCKYCGQHSIHPNTGKCIHCKKPKYTASEVLALPTIRTGQHSIGLVKLRPIVDINYYGVVDK